MAEEVIERSVTEELKTSYLNYAMSVIVARALPDIRDGLKPVHRRILFVMNGLGLNYNRPFKKCATVVGQVISNFHPHGDMAIYESLVRLAQNFSLRYPLITGQGNFGSVDGDKAAAYRYTEARLSKITEEMVADLGKNTVDMVATFDDTKMEPTVLTAAIPNLLINGSSGIAVGMATNIPPHNLKEICATVRYFIQSTHIEKQSLTSSDLMKYVQAPDFPTGGIIYGQGGIRKVYETGRGSFHLRGRASIEPYKKNSEAIIITEIPYQVNKAEMIKKIAQLVKMGNIQGPSEIRDESDRKGMRVVIELKSSAIAKTVLNLLYKHTSLEINYSVNAVALVGGAPRTVNLHDFIHYFVEHRYTVLLRRITYDLKKALARLHIVEGFLDIALPNIDEVIRVIKKSKNVELAMHALMASFNFSKRQAEAVLDMRLSRLVGLEQEKLTAEMKTLKEAIAKFEDLLANREKIYQSIADDMTRISEAYGDERRSEVVLEELGDVLEEDLIQKGEVVVSLTYSGYIKRLPLDTYSLQGRGGMGIRGTNQSHEDDFLSHLVPVSTHDTLLFVSNLGKAYYLKAYVIPSASRISKGMHIKNFFDLAANEKVTAILPFIELSDTKYFIIATRQGKVKRLQQTSLINAKRRGIRAVGLAAEREGKAGLGRLSADEAIGVVEVSGDSDEVMIFTKQGLCLRTSAARIRKMGRAASGVIGMKLKKDDEIIALLKVDEKSLLLCCSERGVGKKFSFGEFSTKGRGGKGMIYMKRDSKAGVVKTVLRVFPGDEVLFTSSAGKVVRIHSDAISLFKRGAQGVKLMNLRDGEKVVEASIIGASLQSIVSED